MKFLKALAATACAFALASAVQAATYTDSSDNYELNHMLATGDNGGDGFGAWEVETHGSGIDGAWAGCGIWDPSANDFQGDWAGKTKAFGIIGKGDGYGANAYRPFRAPLAVGDSFSLEMGVNWDPNAGIDALKGFALLAKGGTLQVLTINHRSNPGAIAINGETDDILNIDEGTYPMKWTFTAKDATTLTVTMTPRDGSKTIYEKDWTVDTSALDGFRLQSSNQNPYEDEKAAEERGETAQMWADRRQTYFDNFTLDVAADLPDLTDLEFTGGEYAVTNNNQELSYTLKRSSSDGELTVNVKSSFEAFIPSTTATFVDGESETTFTVTATLQPKAENKADLTVSGVGCNPAVYANVRAPRYRFSSDTATVEKDATANIWINWDDNGVRDDSKLAFVADPENIVSLPAAWELTGEATDDGGNYIGLYGQTSISGLAYGYTLLALTYDGVVVGDWRFTVPEPLVPGFELSGNTAPKTGIAAVYTLKATLDGAEEGCNVTVAPSEGVTVDPASFDLVEHAEDGFYYQDIEVTFATAGDYTISVASANYSAELPVTVTAPVDPSQFDDYIAYDEASLYAAGFDYDAVGAGSDKFQPWQNDYIDADGETKFAGATIVGSAPDEAALSDGAAFAIFANGADGAEIKLLRPFVNALAPGQAFSLQVAPNYRDGEKSVRISGAYEGVWYDRVVFSFDNNGYYYSIDYGENVSLGWEYGTKLIAVTLQYAADGSSYTLSFAREGDETVTVENFTLPGSVDGVIFRSRNGGKEDENNVVFNRLAIEQVEEPVVNRAIGWGEGTYNPEGDGDYTITLTATTDDIGEVAISVEPAEGALSLKVDTIDLTGVTSATITYTLSGAQENDTFRISATPVDTTVAALAGEGAYEVKVIKPYLTLWCDKGGEFTTDTKDIWLSLSASPSRYGTYTLQSSDPSVLELSVESLTLPTSEGSGTAWFNVFVKDVGYATISVVEDETANWNFTITEGSAEPAALPAYTVIAGRGLAWKASELDGVDLYGSDSLIGKVFPDDWTELKEGDDYVIEGEGEEAQLIVLFDGAFFSGKSIGFIAPNK